MTHTFSNGTEYMMWTEQNCDTCVRAFRPAKGKEMPDFNATQRLVNLGRECKIKFAIEYAAGSGVGDVPDDIAALVSGIPGKWSWQCMMHSSDDNDGPNKPRKPRPPKDTSEDPQQLMLFSIVDEVFEEMKTLEKQYA